jgi:hypothetical protein
MHPTMGRIGAVPMTSTNVEIVSGFRSYAEAQWRRVLSQMDRDPDSPTFGCFDRHYWHYKMRDFPSAPLQQGLFTLEALRKGRLGPLENAGRVEAWCVAAVNALARSVDRAGAVDEYYPCEDSYPGAAFGLYAVARTLHDWREDAPHLGAAVQWEGLRRLARHLGSRVEHRASNQQAAALAALALASRVPEMRVDPAVAKAHADRLLAAQHAEGWFDEYGGPDFGYLTVTIDALVDYAEAIGDSRVIEACDRAVAFLARLVGADGTLPWTLNSRNTDYIVPYGLVRRATENPEAAWLVLRLFGNVGPLPDHQVWATDDRYCCHYIYASFIRSLPHLEWMTGPRPPEPQDLWLSGCGYWVRHGPHWTLYVGANKGGLTRLHRAGRPPLAEHGWRMMKGRHRWTTNWLRSPVRATAGGNSIEIESVATPAAYHVPQPYKLVAVRLLARLLRSRLMPLLKRLLIFREQAGAGPSFTRRVAIDGGHVEIHDRWAQVAGCTVERSPRQNLRHVASADSFSREEWTAPEAERLSEGAREAGMRWLLS